MVPSLPCPNELGFPAKFHTWYAEQIRAIDLATSSDRRFVGLVMPTGSGKSLTGIGIASLHAGVRRAVYLTANKGLQDQLAGDFHTMGLIDLRGQRNYPCVMLQPGAPLAHFRRGRYDTGCDVGPCHQGVSCTLRPGRKEAVRPECLYFGQLWDASAAALVSTNYAMYLAQQEYSEDGLGPIDLLILDEAHEAEEQLRSFLTVELTQEEVSRQLHTSLLDSEDPEDWKAWGRVHYRRLRASLEARTSDQPVPASAEDAHERRILKRLLGTLERLAELSPVEWVVHVDGLRVRACPIRVGRYAEQYLFRGVKHVVLMSATLTRKTMTLLGIPATEIRLWEAPSRFPLERRPIYALETFPSVRVDHRMTSHDREVWVQRIDRFIAPRLALGWKGIIHTVSYQRAMEIYNLSDHRTHMIVPSSGSMTLELVQRFKQSRTPAILLSPSIMTGYDFPGDECRYNIISKVPQLYTQDPLIKAMATQDKEWAGHMAMQKLVQASGRGNRFPQDWCETVIVDDSFGDYFFAKNKRYAPRWFIDAVRYCQTFPEPLMVAAA